MFVLVYDGENILIENGDTSERSVLKNGEYVRSGRFYHVSGTDDYYELYKNSSIGPSRHFTYVFNIFVLLQLFNEFNARKIRDELNIFEGIRRNPLFIGIWLFTVGLQIIMVEVGSWALSCHFLGLTGLQWLVSLGFGVTPLFMRLVLIILPDKYFRDLESSSSNPRVEPMASSLIRRSHRSK